MPISGNPKTFHSQDRRIRDSCWLNIIVSTSILVIRRAIKLLMGLVSVYILEGYIAGFAVVWRFLRFYPWFFLNVRGWDRRWWWWRWGGLLRFYVFSLVD